MKNMFKVYFEDKAIKKLLTALAPELKKRYGGTGPYTHGQVKTTLKELGLSQKYADFAYFVYCEPDQYEKYGFHLEEVKRYQGYKDRFHSVGGTCGSGGEGSCGGGGD